METEMAERPAVTSALDADTFDLLLAVPARLSRLHTAILGALDPKLTFRQYRTLSRVASGFTTFGELAAKGNLTLPTVSENVDGLVRRGLMTSTVSATDRRAAILGITDEGRRAVVAADTALRDFWEFVIEGMPDAELKAATNALGNIYERATTFFRDRNIDRNS
jgi:DNA-binding MarR family transcriptional regulator